MADEDVRVADESGAGESVAYKPKTTNSSDFMFHYPSQLSHLWGRGTLALPWSVVIGRVSSQIIATSQVIGFCRKTP